MLKYLSATFLFCSASTGFTVVKSIRRTHLISADVLPSLERRLDTSLHAVGLDGALSAVDNFYQASPYLAAFLTCSCKASAADWVAQASQQTEKSINRNLAFVVYGGLYQGMVQSFFFSHLFPAMFPDPSIQSTCSQVAIDVLLLGPMFCMPTVYSMKALFAGEEASAGIEKYINHVQNKGILLKYWSIWVPVQALNFGVVPPHLRVPFVAMVSFFWTCLLSTVSSTEKSGEQVVRQQPQPLHVPMFSVGYERHGQQYGRMKQTNRLFRSTSS